MLIHENKALVLFDGYCHMCSRTVQFILKHDKKKEFVFASLQSKTGEQIRKEYQIPEEIDSVLVITEGKIFYYSESVFMIAKRLGAFWKLAFIFKIIPKVWADKLYRWIARNRFRWFGTREMCFRPSENDRDRFL